MRRNRMQVSAAALLLAALFYYVCTPREMLAIALALLCHELGHAVALWAMGLRIQRFRMELKGFCMEYSGYTGALGHAAAAAAGPTAGLIYAFAATALAQGLRAEWLMLSGGVSLVLSAFNLLPALPLDGGRIFSALACALWGERRGLALTDAMGLLVGLLLLSAGLLLLLRGHGIALLLAAIWLLLYQETGRGIVKKREVL